MHTTKTKNCYFIHYGDFKGDVKIIKIDTQEEIEVEFDDLIKFAAEWVKNEKISLIEKESEKKIKSIIETSDEETLLKL
jgi:hypothetical protein